MSWEQVALAGANIVGGLISGGGKSPAEKAANNAATGQQYASYLQAQAAYDYENAQQRLQYDYAKQASMAAFQLQAAIAEQDWRTSNKLADAQVITARTGAEMEWLSRSSQQMRDYEFQQTLQDLQYRSQMRLYEESERTFSAQTGLIARAAQYGYDFTKSQLAFQREAIGLQREGVRESYLNTIRETNIAREGLKYDLRYQRRGIKIQKDEVKTNYNNIQRETLNAYKQAQAQYKSELEQAGLQGAELQRALKQRMAQYTREREETRRRGEAGAGEVASTGRAGNSARRLMNDPLRQSEFQIGTLGVELGFFGQEQQTRLLALAEGTRLSGILADLGVNQLNDTRRFAQQSANLNLRQLYLAEQQAITEHNLGVKSLNLTRYGAYKTANNQLTGLFNQERQAITNTNFGLFEIRQNAEAQYNQALSQRMLSPMNPLQIPMPGPLPQPFIPNAFQAPQPLQMKNASQPLLPGQPLQGPAPVMGIKAPISGSGYNIGGLIGSVASLGFSAYNALQPTVSSWNQTVYQQ